MARSASTVMRQHRTLFPAVPKELPHLVLYGAAMSATAAVAVVVPGDTVGAVPVPGEVEEEAAPHRVARHPTDAPTGISIHSAATERKMLSVLNLHMKGCVHLRCIPMHV